MSSLPVNAFAIECRTRGGALLAMSMIAQSLRDEGETLPNIHIVELCAVPFIEEGFFSWKVV